MNPRKAAVAGIAFVVIAIIYATFTNVVDPSHLDYAGLTMLVALGAAMSLMVYVLFAGLSRNN
jgi:drug/metabolite transporter superfamily protein YnfA